MNAAGRGKKDALTLHYQRSQRGTVEEIVTREEWAAVVRKQLVLAKNGSSRAVAWLTPWVMGAEPKEVTVTVDVEARIRALAIAAGLAPEDALTEARHILAITGEATE